MVQIANENLQLIEMFFNKLLLKCKTQSEEKPIRKENAYAQNNSQFKMNV